MKYSLIMVVLVLNVSFAQAQDPADIDRSVSAATLSASISSPALDQMILAAAEGEFDDSEFEDSDFDDSEFEDSEFDDSEFEDDEAYIEDDTPGITVADPRPIFYWNVAMFHFNDTLYFALLKPVTQAYMTFTPQFLRTGVRNFFENLAFPIRFVNCMLQGKTGRAAKECGRFFVNTTIGLLGFYDYADREPMLKNIPPEDFGQTLGVWGIGNGFFITWPVFGPSTARDTVGMVGDFFLDPINYIESWEARMAIKAYKTVNETSFNLGVYEDLKAAALDPYVAIRDAYIQNRHKKVNE